ncbi:MAG: MFS transporter [Planctomycetes bacterium]|nr:MFS transporter [Planctomycetota bacterium]
MWPLVSAQALTAFNDNAWKLLVIVIGERIVRERGVGAAEFAAAKEHQTFLATAALLIPLVLFSLPGGAIADRVAKRSWIVALKFAECVVLALGAWVLMASPPSYEALIAVLAAMGCVSALLSPTKYGILPELVPHERLSEANGALELWTFLAIIAGTVLGPLLHAGFDSTAVVGLVLLGTGALGLVTSFGIPKTEPARASGSLAASVAQAWAALRADRTLRLCVIGSTWFWALASLLGQALLVDSSTRLALPPAQQGFPLAIFGIGVGIGSYVAGRWSQGKVEVGLVPLGATGLGVFTLWLGVAAPAVLGTFVVLALLGLASGFVNVPINALLQTRAPAQRRGAVIALANVFTYAGMLVGSIVARVLAECGASPRAQFLFAAATTLVGTAWTWTLLPQAFARALAVLLAHTVYRTRVVGRELVPSAGGALLAPNHVSFVDGLFLLASIERPVRFIVDRGQFERPLFSRVLRALEVIPIDAAGGPRALLRSLRSAGDALDRGEVVCIFPEGQITRTGGLQPFRRGLEKIVHGRDVPIVPVHLDRLWGSIFSFERGTFVTKLPRQLPYRVTVSFGAPLPSSSTMPRVRRAVEELAASAWPLRCDTARPLHRLALARARFSPFGFAACDETGARISRLGLLTRAVALARARPDVFAATERVGVLLPPCVAAAVTNLAILLAGRCIVNLNFTVGVDGLGSAARQSALRHVVTSRAFLERAKVALPPGVEPVFLEGLAASIGGGARAVAALATLALPAALLERLCGRRERVTVDAIATVIFSSGSTAEPKGVQLSHFNLDSNLRGLSQVVRPRQDDVVLGSLPLFHSFGFLTLWFALTEGLPIAFCPNPLDGDAIGKVVAERRVTLLLATPTFLQIYARRCTPEQFGSVRVVMTGAEKLPERVADAFEQRFGIRPLEGYGATECAPVIAASVPPYRSAGFFQIGAKRGAVGRPLPGIAVRLVDPDTGVEVETGKPGLLLVRGPNVMRGYLGRDDLTQGALRDGWYVTGDLAIEDEDGFLTITDRLSRFSKIGGEMVPHGKVEDALYDALGRRDAPRFAVTGVPDAKKGERLAVLTTITPAEQAEVLAKLATFGLPNLFVPRADAFVHVDAIPLLGTGKVDLKRVKQIAAEQLGP